MSNKKALVIINESFSEMALGSNTSLAYIVALIEKNCEVYIHNLSKDGKILPIIDALHLNQANSALLVDRYKIENQRLKTFLDNGGKMADFAAIPKFKVGQIDKFGDEARLKLSEVELLIQRLEPMKAPFPPEGDVKLDDVFLNIKKIFPNLIFNCPIDAKDKGLPLELAKNYDGDLATPTEISSLDDEDIAEKIFAMAEKYSKLFNSKNKKIILKPNDSAQGLGIMALEIKPDGMSLDEIKKMKIEQLTQTQTYQILGDNLQEVVKILCFVQAVKANPNASAAEFLYGDKILIQPFLEGVKIGDIRIFLTKNNQGNFTVSGCVFRRSAPKPSGNFTTSLTAGDSILQPINVMGEDGQRVVSVEEEADLIRKIKFIVNALNGAEFKDRYKNIIELGCDFILTGNGKTVMLGEVNHNCPALLPQSEAIQFSNLTSPSQIYNQEFADFPKNYNGGISVAARVIDICAS